MLFARTPKRTTRFTRRRSWLIVGLVLGFALLSFQPVVIGKPNEIICCGTPVTTTTPGSIAFELLWSVSNANEAANWPAYISVDAYDSNGTELPGYPYDDPTPRYSTVVGTSCPMTLTPTASESLPNLTSSGGIVILNMTGEWNNSQCQANYASTCSVTFSGDKRACPGEPNKYEVWLQVTNIQGTGNPAKLKFMYCLVRDPNETADPNDKTKKIIPIPGYDAQGGQHIFRQLTQTLPGPTVGTPVFTIPAANTATNPLIIKDLRIDLSKGFNPTDYVYLDVFVIDVTNPTVAPGGAMRLQVYP
jgi:hypothetical protein